MKKSILIALFAAMPLFAQDAAPAQETTDQAPACRPCPGPRPELTDAQKAEFKAKMLEKFDANKDGQLDDQEKEAMKADFEKHRAERGQRGPKPGCDGKPGEKPEGAPEGRPEGKCCCGCEKQGRPEGARGPKGPRHEMSDEQKAEHKAKMLEKFDANKDGQLDDQEKEAMKADFQKHHAERGQRGPKPGCDCKPDEKPEGAPEPPEKPEDAPEAPEQAPAA